ncbi:hypothetical protein GCM10022226_60790 [Sphaerisporangium flaviroseum]|uniref:Uncharacterized protein n=1 Tax=Sphaerisporangium flaviroseum TaxID=509199 RepID=A0ABP7J103_9ACTN
MSSEEKRAWIYAVIAIGVPVVYFAIILRQVPSTNVADIAYVRPLFTAIGVAVLLNIVATIVAGIASPKEAGKKDERDKQINRFGEYVGFYVMSVLTLVPLGLAMAEFAYFWIANSLYLAFVLAALTSSVVKIVAYRRGL